MSVRAMTWAFSQQIDDASRKLLLLCLADFADENGKCWPSQKRLAELCAGCSVDTIQRHLKVLEAAGLLSRTRRLTGPSGRATDLYELHLERHREVGRILRSTPTAPVRPKEQESEGVGCGPSTPHSHAARVGRTVMRQNPSLEPPLEPPIPPAEVAGGGTNIESDPFSGSPRIIPAAQKESPRTATKKDSPSLPEQLAAVDDPDDSAEARYWKAVTVMEGARVPRSMMAKLAKLVQDFDELHWMLTDIAGKREPKAYLAKVIKNKIDEQRAEAGLLRHAHGFEIPKDAAPMPPFVREFLDCGRADEVHWDPKKRRWHASRWEFDEHGDEIAS